jgi:hypothetical protein
MAQNRQRWPLMGICSGAYPFTGAEQFTAFMAALESEQ